MANQLRRTYPGLAAEAPSSVTLPHTAGNRSKDLATSLLNAGLILPLLDGLDEQGDFVAAVRRIDRGLGHAPTELTLRAAGAAYRARLTGSPAELSELIELAPDLPNGSYRGVLSDVVCAGPALPAGLVDAARRVRNS
ncbi:hypothetical protein STRCI_000225 [Streptomyces cinnabarinus]|uniref:Uncharacterized protein n=1 Tax=Streptomyces cinnabarinus TaxID=67287 RepID=A0ABY7K8I3_9ACTN|nr:hypothetical protein [Streptomyces cinnabarinus]WAZ19191.1 hypothetical protein STRCI_000225 [Streptomyces cinnabarinus]